MKWQLNKFVTNLPCALADSDDTQKGMNCQLLETRSTKRCLLLLFRTGK